MTIQQALMAGGLRLLGGAKWTSQASVPGWQTIGTSGETTTTATTPPAGTQKLVLFTGYNAVHQYLEIPIATFGAANNYNLRWYFAAAPFFVMIYRNGANYLWSQSDGSQGNNSGVAADTSKFLNGASGSGVWLATEFWG